MVFSPDSTWGVVASATTIHASGNPQQPRKTPPTTVRAAKPPASGRTARGDRVAASAAGSTPLLPSFENLSSTGDRTWHHSSNLGVIDLHHRQRGLRGRRRPHRSHDELCEKQLLLHVPAQQVID